LGGRPGSLERQADSGNCRHFLWRHVSTKVIRKSLRIRAERLPWLHSSVARVARHYRIDARPKRMGWRILGRMPVERLIERIEIVLP